MARQIEYPYKVLARFTLGQEVALKQAAALHHIKINDLIRRYVMEGLKADGISMKPQIIKGQLTFGPTPDATPENGE